MEKLTRRHFFDHGPDGPPHLQDEKAACHLCQIRTFSKNSKAPITIVNTTKDNNVLPPDFVFTDRLILRDGVELAEDSFRSGCNCGEDGDRCQSRECSCLADVRSDNEDDEDEDGVRGGVVAKSHDQAEVSAYYVRGPRKGLLKDKIVETSRYPIYECHDQCSCSIDCPNRVVDRGRTIPLQIFRTKDRGWVPIRKGQFVDCYYGEVLTAEHANRRRDQSKLGSSKDIYLFALDKFQEDGSLDPRFQDDPLEIDGEFMSGPTRFINHSCSPNLRIFARVGDHADRHVYDLALFAIRDIPQCEELTFDYLDGNVPVDENGVAMQGKTRCLCKSPDCRGWLFYHDQEQ